MPPYVKKFPEKVASHERVGEQLRHEQRLIRLLHFFNDLLWRGPSPVLFPALGTVPRERPFFLTIFANPDVAARAEEILAGADRLHANPAEDGLGAFQELPVALGEVDLNSVVVFRDFVELKNIGNFADVVDRDLEILEVQERARLPVARDAREEARAELWLEVFLHLLFFRSHV